MEITYTKISQILTELKTITMKNNDTEWKLEEMEVAPFEDDEIDDNE